MSAVNWVRKARVVALELAQPAVGQAQDLGDDSVEQLEVVADDEHGAREARTARR